MNGAAGERKFETDFRFWTYEDEGGERRPDPEPARIYGPVHCIGPLTVCAYLVATEGGLVVVDTGQASDGDLLPENIRKLGFDPADVRLILNTHWHNDHVEGNARLVGLSGAEVCAHRLDAEIVETGLFRGERRLAPSRVDRRLEDGDVVSLGGLDFEFVHTPGQSPGAVVIASTVPGPQGPCRVLFAGDSTGFKSAPEIFEQYGYPGVCDQYRKTISRLRRVEFDLFLGGHPHQVVVEMRPDGNPFVSREEWLGHLELRSGRMERFLKRFPQYRI
ncbi:MAG: MBL fold metallo-hydrolase [Planctomycetota bacterium]